MIARNKLAVLESYMTIGEVKIRDVRLSWSKRKRNITLQRYVKQKARAFIGLKGRYFNCRFTVLLPIFAKLKTTVFEKMQRLVVLAHIHLLFNRYVYCI